MISVCMATYNGEKYIKLQIESILREISSEDELIIQDDDSKDSTLEIIRDFRDSRILLHINEKNIGVILTFENVLKKARGSIIFLADQDDEWLPGKVELVMNEFDKPRVMAVVTNAVIVDSEGKTVMPSSVVERPLSIRIAVLSGWVNCHSGIINSTFSLPKLLSK